MNTVLISTDECLLRFQEAAHEMVNKDYDINEYLARVVKALEHRSLFPESFNTDIELSSGQTLYDDRDLAVLNSALYSLYNSIYYGIEAAQLYDSTGQLRHTHVSNVRYDVALSLPS